MINVRDRISLSWLDDQRHERATLLGLLTLAFILRLAAALIIPLDYRFQYDAVEYVTAARHLLTLGVFGVEPGVPYALIPPGYPLFIASVFALTNQSMMAVRLMQVVLGTLMVWLTFLIGQEVASRRVGLLAAFISATYPIWVVWPAVFLTETLYTVLLLAFSWYLIRSLQVYSVKYAFWAGVTFGLTLLTREILFLFPLLLPVALWWSRISWRHAWRYLLLFAITTLLVLSPWLARNYATFGQAFYTERTEALRYLVTNSGYLSSRYQHMADEDVAPPPSSKPSEYYERFGVQSEWFNINFMLTNPTTYLRQLVNRFVEYWLHPNGLESLPDNLVIRAAYIAMHLGMLGLAGVGLVAGLKRRNVATGVFALLLIYITGTNLFFTGPNPRYNMPFLPLVFILAAIGLGLTWQFLRRKKATRDSKAIG